MPASTPRQPMPRPQTYAEYERARPHMIDTTGRPLELAWCHPCNREHFTVEPHAADAPCPRCKATTGRCIRPSGHEADAWHKGRLDAFHALCDALEAAGHPQVARWP